MNFPKPVFSKSYKIIEFFLSGYVTNISKATKVLVPEMNLGQLSKIIRAEYLVDAKSITKVKGVPFTAGELDHVLREALDD